MTDVNIFIGSEFWEGLIPEEEHADLLFMFLQKLLVFRLFYVTKYWFIGCIFFLKRIYE